MQTEFSINTGQLFAAFDVAAQTLRSNEVLPPHALTCIKESKDLFWQVLVKYSAAHQDLQIGWHRPPDLLSRIQKAKLLVQDIPKRLHLQEERNQAFFRLIGERFTYKTIATRFAKQVHWGVIVVHESY